MDISEARTIIDECEQLKEQVTVYESQIEILKARISDKEKSLRDVMETCEIDRLEGTNCYYGLYTDLNVARPETDEAEHTFQEYVRNKYGEDTYRSMFKMHAQTYKAFVKREREAAEKEGIIDFRVPGVPEMKPYTFVRMKKKGNV